jgi:chorismate mutase
MIRRAQVGDPSRDANPERLVDPFSRDGTEATSSMVQPWSVEEISAEIARLDEELLATIARRTRLARATSIAERAARGAPANPGRDAAIVRRAAERAAPWGLDPAAVRDLYRRIIEVAGADRPDGDEAGAYSSRTSP